MPAYAMISDIHGNIDAFNAVAESIRSDATIKRIVCLGDIIGYCPAANEVIGRLAELEKDYAIRYNLGSHDGVALGRYQFVDLNSETDAETLRAAGLHTDEAVAEEYFDVENRRFIPVRPDARNAMRWTLEHLSPDAKEFLETRLQPRLEIEPGIISVHGSPRDPIFEYVRDAKSARRCFESAAMDGVWLCFVGHTHLPVVWWLARRNLIDMAGRRVCMAPPKPVLLVRVELQRESACYIANVGSVGQPRNRDPRACYMRFSPDERLLEHVFVEYDVAAAAARIREAGLSEHLAERLRKGE